MSIKIVHANTARGQNPLEDGCKLQMRYLQNDVTFILVGIKTYVIYQFILFSA
jgi:hypothetical protein